MEFNLLHFIAVLSYKTYSLSVHLWISVQIHSFANTIKNLESRWKILLTN